MEDVSLLFVYGPKKEELQSYMRCRGKLTLCVKTRSRSHSSNHERFKSFSLWLLSCPAVRDKTQRAQELVVPQVALREVRKRQAVARRTRIRRTGASGRCWCGTSARAKKTRTFFLKKIGWRQRFQVFIEREQEIPLCLYYGLGRNGHPLSCVSRSGLETNKKKKRPWKQWLTVRASCWERRSYRRTEREIETERCRWLW